MLTYCLIPDLTRDMEWIPILPLEENPNLLSFRIIRSRDNFEETASRIYQIFAVVNCLSSTAYFISHFL